MGLVHRIMCHVDDEGILLEHQEFMTRQNIKILSEMRQLPTIYNVLAP